MIVPLQLWNDHGVLVLEMSEDVARILSGLVCKARPFGMAEYGIYRVVVHGEPAESTPAHQPAEEL
jgi:hypothetical protein